MGVQFHSSSTSVHGPLAESRSGNDSRVYNNPHVLINLLMINHQLNLTDISQKAFEGIY